MGAPAWQSGFPGNGGPTNGAACHAQNVLHNPALADCQVLACMANKAPEFFESGRPTNGALHAAGAAECVGAGRRLLLRPLRRRRAVPPGHALPHHLFSRPAAAGRHTRLRPQPLAQQRRRRGPTSSHQKAGRQGAGVQQAASGGRGLTRGCGSPGAAGHGLPGTTAAAARSGCGSGRGAVVQGGSCAAVMPAEQTWVCTGLGQVGCPPALQPPAGGQHPPEGCSARHTARSVCPLPGWTACRIRGGWCPARWVGG